MPKPKPDTPASNTNPDSITITEADFSLADTYARLRQNKTAAAICIFTGLVRDWQEAPSPKTPPSDKGGGGRILSLTLECYSAMAEGKLAEIRTEAMTRWQLCEVVIIHRVGRLLPHDQIVLVAVSAKHREPAIKAAAFIMDYLKTQAPFWKAEETPHGSDWVAERPSDKLAAEAWQPASRSDR